MKDYTRIHFLLDKYWRCKTSVEEERELRHFFAEGNVIPPELRPYEAWFRKPNAEELPPLGEAFDRKLLEQVTSSRKSCRCRIIRNLLVVVMLLGLLILCLSVIFAQK